MKTCILFILIVLLISNSCNISNSRKLRNIPFVEDSLIHIIKLDSNNIDHVNRYFGQKVGLEECKLNKVELMEVENKIYISLFNDSVSKESWLLKNFYKTHRQYIFLKDGQNKFIYILYTFYSSNDEKSVLYFKLNPNIWQNYFFKFMGTPRIFQSEVTYSLAKGNKIQYLDLKSIHSP